MIRQFEFVGGSLVASEGAEDLASSAVWIDMVSPTPLEEEAVERAIGIGVPTRDEMQEIEISSRLYREADADFMTVLIPSQSDDEKPGIDPLTFVLVGKQLVTVRYHEPRAFGTYVLRAAKSAPDGDNGVGVFVALTEAVVDRLADIIERTAQEVDAISTTVFKTKTSKPTKGKEFDRVLSEIGRAGHVVMNIRSSLVTLDRMTVFAAQAIGKRTPSKDIRERVKMLNRDVRSLADHAGFMDQKITFLLDATLGMINIEQNAIIKIFSVAAVVFLPPTLVASIYGMNFSVMPELDWPFGYPFAIGLMIASAIGPYLFFKRKGWL
jgi:magnesium transporter